MKAYRKTIGFLSLALVFSLFVTTVCSVGFLSCPKVVSSEKEISSNDSESFPCHEPATEEPECQCSELGLEKNLDIFSSTVSTTPQKSDLLFYLSFFSPASPSLVYEKNQVSYYKDTSEIYSDSIRLLI
ncbi:hypothetical protein EHQ30_10175 [Leptospira brenneri]|uniref:Lipoprotein n=1 Tax=Leptospira brenneri TaxID=2023182 RepID=A0A5F1ZDT7_9LEPT|nr:hypothetical protein [Leptospira brenneri]TGK96931.1 hypothetical protein EHQ30_10175 [Leptospira brenneri]